MHTVRLGLPGADFHIVGEASLPSELARAEGARDHLLTRGTETHSHGRMQCSGDLIVLFKPGTAAQDLGQPKLADGAFHVLYLALRGRRCFDPLGRFAAHATDHVGMCQGFGRSLRRFEIEGRWNRLGDAGVQGRRSAGDNEGMVTLIPAGHGPVSRRWTNKRAVISQGGSHPHGFHEESEQWITIEIFSEFFCFFFLFFFSIVRPTPEETP
jgi:hypothetical protein